MNKVNLCWVLSDGQKGHEIQSMTLAQVLSTNVHLHHFSLKQPWLTFTPRRMPKFKLALDWKEAEPKIAEPPNIIITTGRRAAAVGKHYQAQLKSLKHHCIHIQILNPKDSLKKYDLVLIPQHDGVNGSNVVNFQGSIHPYGDEWFNHQEPELTQYIAIILGNPKHPYFESYFLDEIGLIRSGFPGIPLYFCGSPRLEQYAKNIIIKSIEQSDKIWLDECDGTNPYKFLLRSAKKLCVTSDSINMMNESCYSQAPVSILASQLSPSPKHQRFIQSINHRLCPLGSMKTGSPIEFALKQITQHPLVQSTLKTTS